MGHRRAPVSLGGRDGPWRLVEGFWTYLLGGKENRRGTGQGIIYLELEGGGVRIQVRG